MTILKDKTFVEVPALRQAIIRSLHVVGLSDKSAGVVTEVFVDGMLRGDSEAALFALTGLIEQLKTRSTDPAAEPILVDRAIGAAVIDARNGPGQLAGILAAEMAVSGAKQSGMVTVGVKNSVSFYRTGYYAERVAEAGMAGLVFSGAAEGNGGFPGTSLAMAVPETEGRVILHELAGVALEGHKGFGLMLVAELLSRISSGHNGAGLAVIAVSPAAFVGVEAFHRRVSDYASEVRSSRRLPGTKMVEMPGETSFRARRRAIQVGQVAVETAAWDSFNKLAERMSVRLLG